MKNIASFKQNIEVTLFQSATHAVVSLNGGNVLKISRRPQMANTSATDVQFSKKFRPAGSFVLQHEAAQEVALDLQAAKHFGSSDDMIESMMDRYIATTMPGH